MVKEFCVLSVAACQIGGLHVLLIFLDCEQKPLKLHVSFCVWSLAGAFLSTCAASLIEQLYLF